MYQNEGFENVLKWKEIFSSEKSDTVNDLIKSIKDFYKQFNDKEKRCTSRYNAAVKAVLDQFPIKCIRELDGNISYIVNGKQKYDIEEVIVALESYVNKFESLKYLDFLSEEKRNVVFVGPNGCGKTTLLRKLKNDTKGAQIYYYPADRVLLVNDEFNPKRAYTEFLKDLDNNYLNSTNIGYSLQGSYLAKQFDYFVNLLERERYEEKEQVICNGKTEKIIKKWRDLVKDRELFFEHGELCVRPIGGQKYPLKYLSSGEKSILYFLIGILLQEKKDFYFIDEPENNLNPAIVSKLWNFIEREMPDSIFVYLTHDSDFVASRINAKIYWIEKYDGEKWSWQQLVENKNLSQELMIQLVGSREPVIFCESKNEYKLDSKVFKLMFPEFKVVPASGCDQVEAYLKAYKTLGLPNKVFGIIDCDYREQEYLDSLKKQNIFHLPFLEIENFLFSEKILKEMIDAYSSETNKELVYELIVKEVKKLFIDKKDEWIAKHVAFALRDKFDYRGKIKPIKNLDEFKTLYYRERLNDDDINAMAKSYENLFNEIIKYDDYNLVLRHLDHKGLMSQFKHILKFKDNTEYEEEVFNLFNSNKGDELLTNLRKEYLSGIIG